MTKSTITREQLLEIIETDHVQCGEASYLARMALAAMDSEPDCNERQLFCSTDTARMKKVISVSAGSEDAPLYRHAQPALAIPDEMTAEQAYEIGYYYGDPVDVFARGANWMRQHIIDSTLAAAPQSPGSEPATVPGKWIPVSERMPEDEQEVLTINKMGHRFVSFFDKHSGLFFDRLDAPAACCIEHVLVTHWMPLPAATQEVKP
ncbi:TPA: DUF551 domain-containing protein [Klebsiella quasipneumoniae subsp. similipneumoniae]|nr:DUF551 domain-containing protein [Klebsiella quasipneumoniae subsp. similipneumoniae]